MSKILLVISEHFAHHKEGYNSWGFEKLSSGNKIIDRTI